MGGVKFGLAGAAACLVLAGAAMAAPVEPGGTIGAPQQKQVHSKPRKDPPGALPPTAEHPNAAAGIGIKYGGKAIDALTYHYDHWRTGWNPAETDLNVANVSSDRFGLLKTLKVDGLVLAQPLLASRVPMPDGKTHDVLIVATGHNTVYAYDAQNYKILWQVNLGPSQATDHVGCGDVEPEFGIAATPVIVRTAKNAATVYLIAATEPNPYEFHAKLHALDLRTGSDVTAPVEISPKATLSNGRRLRFDGQNQWDRSALSYQNGQIYVAIGSHCDHNADDISGWVLSYDPSLKSTGQFNTIADRAKYELASIWMTGFAPAFNEAGDLFAITGNGAYTLDKGGHDYGESVIRLAGDLSAAHDSFTPDKWEQMNQYDADFGSGGLMLIPPQAGQAAPPLAVAVGKPAAMYLLNADDLGKRQAGDGGAVQVVGLNSGVWGGPAYYKGPAGGTVFLQTDNDVLRGYHVDVSGKGELTQTLLGTTQGGYGGSLPVVSSNGGTAGTGVVWVVRRMHDVQLEAYDAANLGAPIYAATAGTWNLSSNNAFVSALEANGRVYVGTYKTVTVFGLTP